MEYKFISCTEDSLEVLRKLSVQTFVETYGHMNTEDNVEKHIRVAFNETQLLLELRNANVFFFMLHIDDLNAGYIKLNALDAQTEHFGKEVIELERIYLLKKFQGKGFGRLLIQEAIREAKGLQCNRMWLGVWKKNPEAVGFYQKMGFKIFDEHIFKVGDEEQSDWMMDIYF